MDARSTVADRAPRRIAWPALLCACAAIALLLAPLWLGAYWMRVLSTIFMFAVIAQGMNVMAGYTGYPAFGNVVFFGLGGYVTAILMVKLGMPFAAAAVLGTLACPLFVAAIGPSLLRLKGHYFAIATLGLNEAMREVVINLPAFTGGGIGLSLPLPPGDVATNSMRFYYLFLAAMIASVIVVREMSRRRLGLVCRAIRDNEAKAEATGLFTLRYKTAAWMLSAAMTGAVGAINAWWMTYIDPPTVFDMAIAVKAFVIFLLGGAATVLGPVYGAFIVEGLATLTWSKLLHWHLGAMGLLIVIVVLVFPDGLRSALKGGILPRILHRLAIRT